MTRLTVLAAVSLLTLTAAGCNHHDIVGVEYQHYTDPEDFGDDGEGEDDGDDGGLGTPDGGFPAEPVEFCGDAEVQDGEECDDGDQNGDENACTSECKINVCGDGLHYEDGEQCDDGDQNGAGGCSEDCQSIE